jgi:hypothetical protein
MRPQIALAASLLFLVAAAPPTDPVVTRQIERAGLTMADSYAVGYGDADPKSPRAKKAYAKGAERDLKIASWLAAHPDTPQDHAAAMWQRAVKIGMSREQLALYMDLIVKMESVDETHVFARPFYYHMSGRRSGADDSEQVVQEMVWRVILRDDIVVALEPPPWFNPKSPKRGV